MAFTHNTRICNTVEFIALNRKHRHNKEEIYIRVICTYNTFVVIILTFNYIHATQYRALFPPKASYISIAE
jgi:hypothetical protein